MLDDVGRRCRRRLITTVGTVTKPTVDVAIPISPVSRGCAAVAAGVETFEAAAAALEATTKATDEAGDDGEEDEGGDDDCDNDGPPLR